MHFLMFQLKDLDYIISSAFQILIPYLMLLQEPVLCKEKKNKRKEMGPKCTNNSQLLIDLQTVWGDNQRLIAKHM